MAKNPSRRSVKFVNVACLAMAAFFFLSFLPLPPATSPSAKLSTIGTPAAPNIKVFSYTDSSRLNILYDNLHLDSLGLSAEAFHKGIAGFLSLVLSGEAHNPAVLSIIDFSKPSTQKRLFVFDMYNETLIFSSLVAHGRNSGKLLATRFSNRPNSFMSSLGFYLTGEPFMGQHGYSLRLEGKEKGWNDNALHRSIIMHPADYVSEEYIRQRGFLGRSEGCPAIPEEMDKSIINSIRGGSCLFIYSPDVRYLHRSRLAS
jgi:hypothetical protein